MSNKSFGMKGVIFFVSTDGDDSWSGKLDSPNADKTDGPFATITRARDAIRELKKQSLSEPVTVMIRGGKYFLDEPVIFNKADSGTKDCPITYMAYPGEKPIISGGRKIEADWKPYKDQEDIRGRIGYEGAVAHHGGSAGGKTLRYNKYCRNIQSPDSRRGL